MLNVGFSPAVISEEDVLEVVDTLRSGWITTGPKTKQFEKDISAYCGTSHTVCLSSATSAMEMVLRLYGIGPGDEVITSVFTYSASASVIHHVGAKIVLCDTLPDEPKMDLKQLEKLINKNTKAIIPVDIGGIIENLDEILEIVQAKKNLFQPTNEYQASLGRVLVLSDAAHSFGAMDKNRLSGAIADITSFSFHAVKNLTTAEGGALTWLPTLGVDNDEMYHTLMLYAIHGQSKDALAKTIAGKWEYDILFPGYKCNMTDINAAIGISQLKRYHQILARRKEMVAHYDIGFADSKIVVRPHQGKDFESCRHLYMTRIPGYSEADRNCVIEQLADKNIPSNVHFKPLPLFTAYKNLGFDIKDFPNAYNYYSNLITLPLHMKLTDEQIDYIVKEYKQIVR